MSYSYLNSIRKHRIRNYFYPDDLKKLPIKQVPLEQQEELAKYAKEITSKYIQINKTNNIFKNWIKNTFEIDSLSKKLENCDELTFKQFLNEMKKNKVNIKRLETYSLLEKGFNNHSSKIIQLMDEIKYLNNQINKKVYEIYDLNEEEIGLIEKSIDN